MSNYLINKNNSALDWMDPFFDGFFSRDSGSSGFL